MISEVATVAGSVLAASAFTWAGRSRAAPAPHRRFADLEARGWWNSLVEGRVQMVGEPEADPGNEDGFLILVADPRGWLKCRVLLAVNGTPEADGMHRLCALPVPESIATPLDAAAWGFDDPTHPVRVTAAVIAGIVNRT